MSYSVRILSTSTLDSSPSILLICPDGSKTLVNCGEGCQRIFLEYGQKVSTIDRICLTNLSPNSFGGLPGMVLTAADVVTEAINSANLAIQKNKKKQKLTNEKTNDVVQTNEVDTNLPNETGEKMTKPGIDLIGPTGTRTFMHSLRHFMRRDAFEVSIYEGQYNQNQQQKQQKQQQQSASKKAAKARRKKSGTNAEDTSFYVESILCKKRSTHRRTSSKVIAPEATIQPGKRSRTEHDEDDIYTCNGTGNGNGNRNTSSSHQEEDDDENRYDDDEEVLSYIFTTPPIPGKFLIDEAKALGIPPGPLYGQLKSGKSISFVNKDGLEQTVNSQQVVEEGSPGIATAILYYPTEDVLAQLQNSTLINSFKETNDKDNTTNNSNNSSKKATKNKMKKKLEVIVHMTSRTIFMLENSIMWRNSFNNDVCHIFLESDDNKLLSSSYNGTGNDVDAQDGDMTPFHASAAAAISRSHLSSTLYGTSFKRDFFTSNKANKTDTDMEIDENNFVVATPLLEYKLVPRSKKGLICQNSFRQNWEQVWKETEELFINSGAQALVTGDNNNNDDDARSEGIEKNASIVPHTNISSLSSSIGTGQHGGELIFTGTGSAIPSKHRNVSGIYLKCSSDSGGSSNETTTTTTENADDDDDGNSMLLDIGEGTIGQLARIKGGKNFISVLRHIKAVWISHPHADHHLGILRLLTERAAACRKAPHRTIANTTNTTRATTINDDPLLIIAPPNILSFIREYEQIEPIIVGTYMFLDCRDISTKSQSTKLYWSNLQWTEYERKLHFLQTKLNIRSITSVPVAHCQYAFAVIIDGTPFGKLSYSGDCRPSMPFAKAAYGTNILIHEATFADGMEIEASLKRHSTIGEALHIGQTMNASTIVLTHFSQRYPKVPPNGGGGGGSGSFSSYSRSAGRQEQHQEQEQQHHRHHENKNNPMAKSIYAFDFLTLTPTTLIDAVKLAPALRLLYTTAAAGSEDDDENCDGNNDNKKNKKSDAEKAMDVPGLFAQASIL